MITIQTASRNWLSSIDSARSHKTFLTYRGAMEVFQKTLRHNGMPASKTDVGDLNEKAITWFLDDLKELAPASEVLYLTAIRQFYKYLMAEDLATVNLQKIEALVKMRMRRPGRRLPQFSHNEIHLFIERALKMTISKEGTQRMIDLRDRALIVLLPDTGLRVHEAVKLIRGDIDWDGEYLTTIGKGDKQAIVRMTPRSIKAIKQYLNYRSQLDGGLGIPLTQLPIFARHDPGAGKKIKPITTKTARMIIHDRLFQLLEEDERARITPHSFRHYFVSQVLRNSGGNLKLAQELARHTNIQVTQRYAHLSDNELDQGYYESIVKGSE